MDIRNCTIKFKCSKTWESLAETKLPNVRYCEGCDRGVHYCENETELKKALDNDRCVAIDLKDIFGAPYQLLGDLELDPDYDKHIK